MLKSAGARAPSAAAASRGFSSSANTQLRRQHLTTEGTREGAQRERHARKRCAAHAAERHDTARRFRYGSRAASARALSSGH